MIFIVISVVVPIGVYLTLPLLLRYHTKKPPQHNWLLAIAGGLFLISWYLPSPLVAGQQTAFMTHLVGGGIFTGLIWIYLKENLQWKSSLLIELASIYALVSALGVANELFELALVQLRLIHLSLTDTAWDLLANTVGAILVWSTYQRVRISYINQQGRLK